MFTWNIQFVSRKRLADTLNQLMISEEGDRNVLVRIHTAVHTGEEAADLAVFIKGILPEAQILGTSTSAIISEGRLIHDQCLISVTQMDGGNVETCRIPRGKGLRAGGGAGAGGYEAAVRFCAGKLPGH